MSIMRTLLHATVAFTVALVMLAGSLVFASEDVVYYTPLALPLPWVLSASCYDETGASTASAIALDVHTSPSLPDGHADLTVRTNVCVKFMGLQKSAFRFTSFPLKNIFSLPLGARGSKTLSAAEVTSLSNALGSQVSSTLLITHDLNPGSSDHKYTLHLSDSSGAEVGAISLFLASKSYAVPIAKGPRIIGLWPITSVEANAMGYDFSGRVSTLFHYMN